MKKKDRSDSADRSFSGKTYNIWAFAQTKARAIERRDEVKKRGHLARVVKSGKEYIVWYHEQKPTYQKPYQTGKRKDTPQDKRLKAKYPGKRKSSAGKTYTERRRNRSDMPYKML